MDKIKSPGNSKPRKGLCSLREWTIGPSAVVSMTIPSFPGGADTLRENISLLSVLEVVPIVVSSAVADASEPAILDPTPDRAAAIDPDATTEGRMGDLGMPGNGGGNSITEPPSWPGGGWLAAACTGWDLLDSGRIGARPLPQVQRVRSARRNAPALAAIAMKRLRSRPRMSVGSGVGAIEGALVTVGSVDTGALIKPLKKSEASWRALISASIFS